MNRVIITEDYGRKYYAYDPYGEVRKHYPITGEEIEKLLSGILKSDIKKLEVETEIKIPISKKQYEDLKLYFKDHGKFIRESMQEDTYYIQNIIVF